MTKTAEQISYNMSRVRTKDTDIEKALGKAMWAAGIRYRKQYKALPGKPDFALVSQRIAIFCDSAFWHGRNWQTTKTCFKSNRDFWIPKIEGNIRRDSEVNERLRAMGWRVLRFWDQEINSDISGCVARVLSEKWHASSKEESKLSSSKMGGD